jgi:hypothetical protein
MLEARTVTSGATGRNGGHIKDAPFHVYAELKDRFGKHAAQKIVRFRLSHLDTLIRIAGECGHDSLGQCEMRRVQGIHAIVDPGMWEEAKAKLENFLSDMPDQREQWSIHAGEDLEVRTPVIFVVSVPDGCRNCDCRMSLGPSPGLLGLFRRIIS